MHLDAAILTKAASRIMFPSVPLFKGGKGKAEGIGWTQKAWAVIVAKQRRVLLHMENSIGVAAFHLDTEVLTGAPSRIAFSYTSLVKGGGRVKQGSGFRGQHC